MPIYLKVLTIIPISSIKNWSPWYISIWPWRAHSLLPGGLAVGARYQHRMPAAKDSCDPGGLCWAGPCRHSSQGFSFPTRTTQNCDWACPKLQLPSHRSLAVDLLIWAWTPPHRVTSWSGLNNASMAPPGHPSLVWPWLLSTDLSPTVLLSDYNRIVGFSEAQRSLVINSQWKEKKHKNKILIKHTFFLFISIQSIQISFKNYYKNLLLLNGTLAT